MENVPATAPSSVAFSNLKYRMQTNGRAELKTVFHAVSNNR